MNPRDVKEIEKIDLDIIENTLVAIREVWNKKLFILLVSIAGFLVSLIFINVKGNSVQFYSSATLYSAAYGATSSDANAGVAAMNRYVDLIGSSRVCNRAAQSLTQYGITAQDLRRMVTNGNIRVSGASAKTYGYKLTLSVFSDSSTMVIPLTNTMASAFAAELNELIGSNSIQVMDEATRYSSYNTMNTTLYMAAFTGGAFVLAAGIIFCLGFFSMYAKSVAQCEADNDYILGLIPYIKNK